MYVCMYVCMYVIHMCIYIYVILYMYTYCTLYVHGYMSTYMHRIFSISSYPSLKTGNSICGCILHILLIHEPEKKSSFVIFPYRYRANPWYPDPQKTSVNGCSSNDFLYGIVVAVLQKQMQLSQHGAWYET